MKSLNNINLLWFDLTDFVRRNLKKILVLLIFFAVGVIIGIWYGFSIDDVAEKIENSPNIYILIKLGENGAFSFFLKTLILCIFLTALIFLLSFHSLLSYLCIIIPLYCGYCLGFEIIIMLRICGISAIVLSLLGILILRLGLGMIFILLSVSIIEQACSFAPKQQIFRICCLALIAATLFLIIMSIFMPFFCKLLAYSA